MPKPQNRIRNDFKSPRILAGKDLEDRNPFKLKSLDFSCPFCLSDTIYLGTTNSNAMIARLNIK